MEKKLLTILTTYGVENGKIKNTLPNWRRVNMLKGFFMDSETMKTHRSVDFCVKFMYILFSNN